MTDKTEPPLKGRLKKIKRRISKSYQGLARYLSYVQELVFKLFKNDKKLYFQLGILIVIAMMPVASEAAMNSLVQSEIMKFSEPTDPVLVGQFASQIDSYTPGINENADEVALTLMLKSDNYTLSQQLSINSDKQIDGPERAAATYEVKGGETVMQIAQKFGLHVASILDANDIRAEDANKIEPGDVLDIPSSDTSDSTEWLVAIHKAEEEKKKIAEAAAAKKKKLASTNSPRTRSIGGSATVGGVRLVRAAKSNEIQCYTYVVSQGYAIGGHLLARWIPTNSSAPQAGGLVVTNESWAGHVAIVTSVNGDGTFNIRESNYIHGLITERTLSIGSAKIIGYRN